MSDLMDHLVLLAFKPATGVLAKSYLHFALPGAILIELTRSQRVVFGEKSRVTVSNNAPTGDERLDEALKLIEESKKPRAAAQWVMNFPSKIKKLTDRSIQPMIDRGTVRAEPRSFLGVFRWTRYTLADPSERDRFVAGVLAMLRGEQEVKVEWLPAIQVANAVGMMRQHLPKEERKELLKALKEIGRDEVTGKAVDAATAAATMAATSAVTTAAISASSH